MLFRFQHRARNPLWAEMVQSAQDEIRIYEERIKTMAVPFQVPLVEVSKPVILSDKPKVLPRNSKPLSPEMEEYLVIAQELGTYQASQLSVSKDQQIVADFLWEHDIDLYDFKEVEAYMNKMAAREGKYLVWKYLL